MAWTAPRTWVATEVVTASIMNTHVRDNLLETGPAKVTAAGQSLFSTGANALAAASVGAVKASATSWNNSTTLTNVTDMSFAVVNGEKWLARYFLKVSSSASSAGLAIGWTYPTATTALFWALYPGLTGSQTVGPIGGAISGTGTSSMSVLTRAATAGIWVVLYFYAGGTGTVQMQAAQSVAAVQTDSIDAGSVELLQRLA